jgi:hypothetical protein
MAKSQPQSATAFIKGSFDCQLTGGFIAQAYSSALAQFSVDGKGNVTGSAGELNVSVGGSGIPNPNNTDADFLNPSQYIFQTCSYSPASGSYTLAPNGTGTIAIDWTASANNADSPLDCTPDITTNFNLVVNSPGSFLLSSTDILNGCASGNINYAACGSSFAGTCQLQAPKL